MRDENPNPVTFLIKKRISTELFIDENCSTLYTKGELATLG